MEYENYGDINPLEHGRLVKKNDNNTFDVFYVEPTGPDKYIAAWLYYDPEDSWLQAHKDEILKFSGADESDTIGLMLASIDYYGFMNFSPTYISKDGNTEATKFDVLEVLKSIDFPFQGVNYGPEINDFITAER